jgi:charged multivesicular body protein 1
MTSVVRGMDRAMESMNLERISLVMDKFESQFADLDVQTSYMEDTMQNTTAVSTPQDQIDELMKQTAEEVRLNSDSHPFLSERNAVADGWIVGEHRTPA